MDLKTLLDTFPGAKDAYYQSTPWSWKPRYEDGYPSPTFQGDRWHLIAIYPAFEMRLRTVQVEVHEMTPEGGRSCAVTVPLSVGSEKLRMLFSEISHECWKATRNYLSFVRITGKDPLYMVSAPGEDKGTTMDAALEATVLHYDTENGRIAVLTEGSCGEYTH